MSMSASPIVAGQRIAPAPYYPALTGLRAVAALLVFITHSNTYDNNTPLRAWLKSFAHQGYIGVSIFFVLSGFLIATRYSGRVEPSWTWARRYMQNRVARIYPLYFLLTVLTLVVGALYPAYDYSMDWHKYSLSIKALVVFLNLTFLRGFFADFVWTGVSQAWSLAVEETFYVFAPLILWTVAGRPLRLVWWTVGLLGAGLALGQAFTPHAHALLGLFGTKTFVMDWTFFGHVFEFTSGIALALLIARQGQFRLQKRHAWATYGGIAWIIGGAALGATIEWKSLPISWEQLRILMVNIVLPPGVCLLLYGLLRERTSLRWLLETKALDLLGKSSYAFYLIHLGTLSIVFTQLGLPLSIKFLISLGLSIALYKLVEEPAHKYLKGFRFDGKARQSLPAPNQHPAARPKSSL
jgi:peptidoglycan/LPS O-acetylase OafA/YrhL